MPKASPSTSTKSVRSLPSSSEIQSARTAAARCATWEDARSVIAKVLNRHPDTITRLRKRLTDEGALDLWVKPESITDGDGDSNSIPSITTSQYDDTMSVDVAKSKAATLDEVIQLCKIDTAQWESKGFTVRPTKDGHTWSARFAKKKQLVNPAIIEELKKDLKNYAPHYDAAKRDGKKPKNEDGKLLVVSLFDAHLGKLSWAESDGENYDLKIAKEVYMRALYDLIEKAKKQSGISRILFPIGNDYLTCDSSSNETSAGTPQSVDGRFPKIFREARKLLVQAIDCLRKIAPVDIIVVCGNHERESMFHLGDALECWYHNDADVSIDNDYRARKYYKFGRTVIGLAHGDTIKQDRLPLLGAYERPDLWSECSRRVWYLGHHHHYQLKEYTGVQVWILPSLSGSDTYHQQNGFVGAARCAVAFLHGSNGMEAMFQSEPEN